MTTQNTTPSIQDTIARQRLARLLAKLPEDAIAVYNNSDITSSLNAIRNSQNATPDWVTARIQTLIVKQRATQTSLESILRKTEEALDQLQKLTGDTQTKTIYATIIATMNLQINRVSQSIEQLTSARKRVLETKLTGETMDYKILLSKIQ